MDQKLKQLGQQQQIELIAIADDISLIKVSNDSAAAVISVYGGQVLSFKPKHTEHDLFYLSEQSVYQQGTAIRGGIPLCWPWFGDDSSGLGRQAHGFARDVLWEIDDYKLEQDASYFTLTLESSELTKQWCADAFKLRLEISITDKLSMTWHCSNTGDKDMQLSQAMHSYFRIGLWLMLSIFLQNNATF